MRGNLLGIGKWTGDLCLGENFGPGAFMPLSRGYIHVYDHDIQTSSLKSLGQLKPNFIGSIYSKGEQKYI